MKNVRFDKFQLFGVTTITFCILYGIFALISLNQQQQVVKEVTKTRSSVLSATTTSPIKTVFIIMLENHNWSGSSTNPTIKGSASAPYINNTLLPQSSYANQYFNPPGNHPSEPNYIWLEAGSNLGVTNDNPPSSNHQSTTNHLVTLLTKAGVTWKSYQEDISGTTCPLGNTGLYAPKHNPMIFFDDVTNTNSATSQTCIQHIRPYTEFASDLAGNKVAQYNFITPNLCDDMHNSAGCPSTDSIKNGDNWLAANVPAILNSQAYKNGGALFIGTEEGEGNDGPIMMLVLSSLAKGKGYNNSIHYDHSSMLKTVEEIFGVSPMLGAAANATDLSDLFSVPIVRSAANPTSTIMPTPSAVTPTFVCAGSPNGVCGTTAPSQSLQPSALPSSANIPSTTMPSSTPLPSTSTSIAPSASPCVTTNAIQSVQAEKNEHKKPKHKKQKKGQSNDGQAGLLNQLLQLLKQLEELINKLTSGGSNSNPTPAPC